MYYNATLAQPWPRGVRTLRKHMLQIDTAMGVGTEIVERWNFVQVTE